MRPPTELLALPVSLLAATSQSIFVRAYSGPTSLAPHDRYSRKHGALLESHYQAQQRPATTFPSRVRKMGEDEGEKFFLHYWSFGETTTTANTSINTSNPEAALRATSEISNTSAESPLRSPERPHIHHKSPRYIAYLFGRSPFERDFQCPTGTTSCTTVGQSNACCGTSETCISIQDTGNGPVGCCPSGKTCAGQVVDCDTAAGYTNCPDSSNGGCCIPGYTCQGVGCVYTGSITTTITLPLETVTTGTTTEHLSSKSTATSSTATVVVITSSAGTKETSTTYTSSSTGSITVSAVAPVRPTSGFSDTSSSYTTSDGTYSGCPTGFYMCSAYYLGGCCRVDRNCDTTSCPAAELTSAVVTSGLTIVAGGSGASSASAAATPSTGTATRCASGWMGCASSTGGGCCPSGFVCGAVSCTATASGQSGIAKESSGASPNGHAAKWGLGILGVVAGVGMIVL